MKTQQGAAIMGQDAAFIQEEEEKIDFSAANMNLFLKLKGDLMYKLRNMRNK